MCRLAIGPGALSASPKWAIDAWTPGPKSVYDTAYDFIAGVPVPIRMEYRKPDGNGNVELQWSLIGNATLSLEQAASAAAEADLTVVAVGGSDQTTNEGCDRAELDLPGRQLELVQTVHAAATAAKKKLVVVLIGGRPIAGIKRYSNVSFPFFLMNCDHLSRQARLFPLNSWSKHDHLPRQARDRIEGRQTNKCNVFLCV